MISEGITEKAVGHIFQDRALLNTALTHCSFGQPDNERLEYLGDAVLQLIITDTIFGEFPSATEGQLTRLRASLVKKNTLATLARSLNLGKQIRLGAGEIKNNGCQRDSILADTFEAMIGAIYLDAGMTVCTQRVHFFYDELLNKVSLSNIAKDSKTTLQELLQSKRKELPEYKVVSEGDINNPLFVIACNIPDQNISAQAKGKSKRIAEQLAAEQALLLMQQTEQI